MTNQSTLEVLPEDQGWIQSPQLRNFVATVWEISNSTGNHPVQIYHDMHKRNYVASDFWGLKFK